MTLGELETAVRDSIEHLRALGHADRDLTAIRVLELRPTRELRIVSVCYWHAGGPSCIELAYPRAGGPPRRRWPPVEEKA